ncbi:MAG: ABC transporter ATP-binding protein [Bacillota bacterium]
MIRVLKELKPFTILIIIIIGLLFLQAMTDLALPQYMSRIVNVGIQQSGIEDAVPEVMRVRDFEKVKQFISEEEEALLRSNYQLIEQGDLTPTQLKNYLKKYPALKAGALYILKAPTPENRELLNKLLGRTFTILSFMEGELGLESMEGQFPGDLDLTDPRALVDQIPRDSLEEQFANMPPILINQLAVNYIKLQYEEMGINIANTQTNYILTIGGIMLLIALLGVAASISVGFLAARVSASLGKKLRESMFKKVLAFSNQEFGVFSTASLITRSTNDIQQIQMFTAMSLRMVFYAPILGIGGVIKTLKTNTSMAWIVALGVITILVLVTVLFSIAIPRFKRVQKLIDKVNLVMREILNGLLVIRAFNTQRFEEKRFDLANIDLTKNNLFIARLMTFMMPTMMLIMNSISLLIVWIGANEISKGTFQVGDMMAFMQYAMQILMSFLMISMLSIILPRASVSAQRIAEVLEEDLTILDPTQPEKFSGPLKGHLEFKNVCFKYPEADECVIKDISFTALPGETTAFVGGTGSGKSTLVNLIPRFYDVTEGEVLLDGTNIKHVSLYDLREKIGYVPQKNLLFKGTIDSNLKFGKGDLIDDQMVEKAIEMAQAKEFINSKEEGLQFEISQGGTNVSGGQRQRLAIARAITKRPEIFIFDDSFSALDFKTDAALRKALRQELKDQTVLIVAQRINTILHADKIIVLDEGEIVGMGSHDELLRDCEVYRQIALSQLSEEELAR